MSSRSYPVVLANQRWFSSEVVTGAISDEQKQWLTDRGSLTARLQERFAGEFRVELLFHDWDLPSAAERRFIPMPIHERASIREVLLICSGAPAVFARSIIPASSIKEHNKKLLDLGDKPLGEFIFAQPDMQRSPIEITQATDRNGRLIWGRRSRFTLAKEPLAVYEYFLPALFDR